MDTRLSAIALSDKGLHRSNNEDNMFFNHHNRRTSDVSEPYRERMASVNRRCLFVVCDGMGGEALGEEASYLATSGLAELEERFERTREPVFQQLMVNHLQQVNEQICETIVSNRGLRMGTTFAGLLIGRQTAQAINIGDSMIYMARGGEVWKLSRAHNHAQRLVEMGILTAEEAVKHPERHRLTQHLGMFEEERLLAPTLSPEIWLKPGDRFMLTTDGITDMIDWQTLERLFSTVPNITKLADHLMTLALEAGGKDNLSLQIIEVNRVGALDPQAHPNAVKNPPFELYDVSFKPQQDPIEPNGHGAAVPIIPQRIPAQDTLQPPIRTASVQNSDSRAGMRPDTAIGYNQPVRIKHVTEADHYQLTDEEEARFEQAKQDAKRRQEARKAAERVSSVVEDLPPERSKPKRKKRDKRREGIPESPLAGTPIPQPGQTVQPAPAPRQQTVESGQQAPVAPSRKERKKGRGFIRGLLFFLLFVFVGYAAVWLLFNGADLLGF